MDIVAIPLYGGRKGHEVVVAHALVDAEDAERVNAFRWGVQKSSGGPLRYARRYEREGMKQRAILMHKAISGFGFTDHINRDGLDNRKENLRPVTHAQNMQNRRKHCNGTTSPERGVSLDAHSQQWRAQVALNGRKAFTKFFPNHDDAVMAVREARRRLLPFATN